MPGQSCLTLPSNPTGESVPEADQEARTKESGVGEPGESSLPALARFGLSSRNPTAAPATQGIRRKIRERDWLHHRRDKCRPAFGSIVAPPYQPLSNSSSERSLRGEAKQR